MEVDFRLNFFAKKIQNKYLHLSDYLTFYRKVDNGIMSKSKKFSYNWWFKRLMAHYFIRDIYTQNKITHKKNCDFYLTKAIVHLLNKKNN